MKLNEAIKLVMQGILKLKVKISKTVKKKIITMRKSAIFKSSEED